MLVYTHAKGEKMILSKKHKTRGFSLIEVLIVLVILGVLAGLAIPIFSTQIQRTYQAEALGALDALRGSLVRYYADKGFYTTLVGLDYDPNFTAGQQGGQTRHFNYTVTAPTALTFTATGTRNTTNTGDGSSTVAINQAGDITKTGIFD
jgi:type IV pilus assembly protein PilE